MRSQDAHIGRFVPPPARSAAQAVMTLLVLPLVLVGVIGFVGRIGAAEAQAADIAILKSSSIAAYDQAIEGFKATAPSDAVYMEFDLQGDLELGRKLARKIRASEASLVVAVGLKAAQAAKMEIPDTPIVYMMVLDPQRHNLASPNLTGTLLEIPVERQLKLIRTFLPGKRRFGTLYDPRKSTTKVREAEQQAAALSFELKSLPVESEKDVPQQLRTLLTFNETLWLMPDSTVLTNESIGFILESAQARGIPVVGFSPELTRLGALLSFSVTYGEVGRETGLLAKRILDGDKRLPMKPIPIERLKITVNMKIARFLGIEFPRDVSHLIDEAY
ncbi:MAG TPA: ABC transporter substrate-binding protein [Nitrospira sp.]|nr:ABC transporter substrate-binding protein [Nitrospira sp.]